MVAILAAILDDVTDPHISNKTKSTPVSPKGQVTKHITVQWYINYCSFLEIHTSLKQKPLK